MMMMCTSSCAQHHVHSDNTPKMDPSLLDPKMTPFWAPPGKPYNWYSPVYSPKYYHFWPKMDPSLLDPKKWGFRSGVLIRGALLKVGCTPKSGVHSDNTPKMDPSLLDPKYGGMGPTLRCASAIRGEGPSNYIGLNRVPPHPESGGSKVVY